MASWPNLCTGVPLTEGDGVERPPKWSGLPVVKAGRWLWTAERTVPGCPGDACAHSSVPQGAEGHEELGTVPSLQAVLGVLSHGRGSARGPKLQLQPPWRGDGVCQACMGKCRQ